jgi:hypothetical protein
MFCQKEMDDGQHHACTPAPAAPKPPHQPVLTPLTEPQIMEAEQHFQDFIKWRDEQVRSGKLHSEPESDAD